MNIFRDEKYGHPRTHENCAATKKSRSQTKHRQTFCLSFIWEACPESLRDFRPPKTHWRTLWRTFMDAKEEMSTSASGLRPWSPRDSPDPRIQSHCADRGHGETHMTLRISLAAQSSNIGKLNRTSKSVSRLRSPRNSCNPFKGERPTHEQNYRLNQARGGEQARNLSQTTHEGAQQAREVAILDPLKAEREEWRWCLPWRCMKSSPSTCLLTNQRDWRQTGPQDNASQKVKLKASWQM